MEFDGDECNVDVYHRSIQFDVAPQMSIQDQFFKACNRGSVDDVKLLLVQRADVNGRCGRWLDTPLHRACVWGPQRNRAHLHLSHKAMTRNVRNKNSAQSPA